MPRYTDKPLKRKLLTLKVSELDMQQLMFKAQKYAGGNLSLWLRVAGKEFIPKDQEGVTDEDQRD